MSDEQRVQEVSDEQGSGQGSPAEVITTDERPPIADLLDAHREERHLVVLHDFPDPDAISSGFAHQLLSSEFEIETDLVYGGTISHQQNVALVRLLGIELNRYEQALDLEQYDGVVFVDSQGTTCEEICDAVEAADISILIVVDHHEKQDRLQPEFSDIRRVGATATMYAGYLSQGPIEMDKSQKAHVLVATALMHGIVTDTADFLQAKAEDFYAAAFLSQFRDAELLQQIRSQARSRQVMNIIHQALGNRITAENFSIAGIGYLRYDDRDAIPQAADFLLTEENVHTAIVYGIVKGEEEETLVGSLRTSKITINPDEFIKDTFGQDKTGEYFGGGKTLAGAFEIPIGFLSGENVEEFLELKWQVYDTQIKQKIFTKIGFNPE